MSPATLIPLASGLGYAVAALLLKRATEYGTGPWRAMFVTNWVSALVFSLWVLRGGAPFAWAHLGHAALAGAAFFVGQIFTFLALHRGDVSVATPVLGTKVIFVVLFSALLGTERITAIWWFAALLTAVGTALLGYGAGRARHFATSLAYGFSAAAAYALTDVFCQMWAPAWGFGYFAPTMFGTMALLSLTLIPLFRSPLRALPRRAYRWLIAGGVLLAVQSSGVAYSIIVHGSATRTNILYNTRGIWSVVLVWIVGHWFANKERDQGRAIMLRRLCGAALLLVAIFLTTYDHR